MHAEENSVIMSKAEAWTYVAFAGEGAHQSKVHLRIGRTLKAAATKGKASVVGEGKAARDAVKGKWSLDVDFVEQARASVVESTESIRFELACPESKPPGLPRAHRIRTETGESLSFIEWPRAAEEDKQLTIDDIDADIPVPDDRNYKGSWGAFDPEAFGPLKRLKVAVDGQPVTLYPPPTEGQPFVFEVRHEHCHWKAAISTEKVLAPGDKRDEPPPADEGAPGRADRQVKLDLEARAKAKAKEAEDVDDADDGIIDDEEAAQLKAQQEAASGDPPEPELETSKRKRKVKASQMKPKKGRGK
jgi:hypothetical protein